MVRKALTKMHLPLVLLGIVLLIFIANKVWSILSRKSLALADQIELSATYDRWTEAGRPQGEALNKFLEGRRPDLVICTQVFTVSGSNFVGQFALTNSKAGYSGTLVITTNKVLLSQAQNGRLSLIHFRR